MSDETKELQRDDAVRFRSLIEQAPFSIQVFAPDGRTIRVNKAWEELWGVPFEDMVGVYNILEDPQLEANGTLAELRKAFAGQTVRLAPIIYNPNETIPGIAPQEDPRRWLSAVAYPIKDASGRVMEVVMIHEDITARMRAEEERSRSEQRVRLVLESITDAFFAVDENFLFSYVNAQAEELVWRKPGELLGKSLFVEFPGLYGSDFEKAFRRCMTERITVKVTSYYPDHERWYEVHMYPSMDGGISVYFRDVSEQKRIDENLARLASELRESERIYRAIGESIDYGVWICDPEGRNVYASESFLKLVGLTQEECSSFGWSSVLHPDELDATMAAWQQCVQSGTAWDREHRFRGVDGQWHPVLARGVPVRDSNGEVRAWAGINLDIGRLKNVEIELREADRRKDEFLATLAHELRNPLAPIRNSLQILKMSRVDPEIAQQTREMMERQVHHLVRLVDDLLDVSRVMRGRIELRTERVELASVVARAVETAQPFIEVQNHSLEVSLPRESLPMDADPVRLTQVVANLLTNAAKYTEPNGSIRLSAEREGSDAVLRVRDNGIGIAADMLPRIFELFVQVDHAASRSQSGLGIGLTLVSKLVEMHGGSVEARSEGLGQGCEFIVRLPLALTALTEEELTESEAPGSRPSGLRLLVVDDNEDAALSLAMLLRMQGHDVRVAHDGETALAVTDAHRPKLIFLDLGMPGMDGFEVARRIREKPSLEGTRIAALTGWGQEEDRRRTAEAGFDHHLVKPLEPRLLERLMAELIVA